MVSEGERYVWYVAFVVLVALTVPWFLWRSSDVAFGLPVWLWWHIAWMGVTAVAFWAFAQRAWGIGIEEVPADG